ncbi:antibiotic biosynthesis monooxygenase family protein [Alicyclobacillus dauci]|uniref:Antibiotic biosynthesis monooxygenase n=1 Tax=Alicyclobacillus dauci TaxID=1475485 RepID=A0ABY6Z4J7_9BACL|nr:antibiotic biosynthesis monooxygenase [Alicyclobacillus dauci]WAH37573.1 antibiotic biosynthesis monooxygenase [Alicyclobacillus dauci]
MNEMIAQTPNPPYYAVIFTSTPTANQNGYRDMAHELMKLVQDQPGFLGAESVENGLGIIVSYWDSLDAIRNWKNDERHSTAQAKGKTDWYKACRTRICRVEHDYGYEH